MPDLDRRPGTTAASTDAAGPQSDHPVDRAVETAQDAATSKPMGWLARLGLVARGLVYLVMGWLAVLLATGDPKHVDQRGAITELVAAPLGSFLVLLLVVGFAAYAVWRLSEAAFGVTGEGPGAMPRLKSLGRGLAYAALALTALSVLGGARGTQAGQQGHLAGQVMQWPAGRWIVGLVGAAIVVVGVVMVREGWSRKFLQWFGAMPPGVRRPTIVLGRVGTVARGIVFAVTGVLVVVAAWNADPSQAGGIDAAVRTLLGQPYGHVLVALLGVGLMIFGVFGLVEAAYRRVPGEGR